MYDVFCAADRPDGCSDGNFGTDHSALLRYVVAVIPIALGCFLISFGTYVRDILSSSQTELRDSRDEKVDNKEDATTPPLPMSVSTPATNTHTLRALTRRNALGSLSSWLFWS